MMTALFRSMILAALTVQTLGLALLQGGASFLRHSSKSADVDESTNCAPLENHQTFFTVTVSVGTPPQNFSLVADTGSDSLLIPSCLCVEAGYCYTGPEGKCFRGTNISSSFKIHGNASGPATAILTYGSGAIKVVLASDLVKVGNVETYMHDGVLLMTDEALDFSSAFEGILGLGPPSRTPVGQMIPGDGNITYDESQRSFQDPRAAMGAQTMLVDEEETARQQAQQQALQRLHGNNDGAVVQTLHSVINHKRVDGPRLSKSFLREAQVERFSVCFDPSADGVLRLDTAPHPDAMNSIGGMHWGLELQAVTIGESIQRLDFCQPGNKSSPEQVTACAAIPDSGTTVMAGPKEQLLLLIEGLCEQWQRCADLYNNVESTAQEVQKIIKDNLDGHDPWKVQPMSKAEVFLNLVDGCSSWYNESGLSEMPNLQFHVGDLNGSKKVLEIPPSAYIIEMQESEEDDVYMFADGLIRQKLKAWRSERRGSQDPSTNRTVCSPAFEPMDYETPENGPVWILGMPIFYQYQVHYDQNEQNPTIAFTKESCGTCGSPSSSINTEPMLLAKDSSLRSKSVFPKKINKPLRTRVLDKSKPFGTFES